MFFLKLCYSQSLNYLTLLIKVNYQNYQNPLSTLSKNSPSPCCIITICKQLSLYTEGNFYKSLLQRVIWQSSQLANSYFIISVNRGIKNPPIYLFIHSKSETSKRCLFRCDSGSVVLFRKSKSCQKHLKLHLWFPNYVLSIKYHKG